MPIPRRLILPCALLGVSFCISGQSSRSAPATFGSQSRGAWEGKGTPIVEDFKDSRPSRTYLLLHSSDGDLKVFRANPAELRSGTHRYHVEGTRAGRTVAADIITPLDSAASSDTCATTGVQKTIAIPVGVPGALAPTSTPADIQNWLFGTGLSLNGYIQEASYGQTSVSGTVTGWFMLDQTYTADQLGEIQQVVFQEAMTQGIDLTQYSHILLYLPSLPDAGFEAGASDVGCGELTQGNSTFNASVEWILEESSATTTDFLHNTFHEFGHGLGLLHSTSLDCGAVSLPPDPSSCQVLQYGDPYSLMGGGNLGHYTAPQKYALGWIQDAQVVTIASSGTATLAPVSAQGPGMRAIRTPRTVGSTDWMWIEAREPVGPYESTNFPVDGGASNAGAVVHFQPQSAGGAIANLTQAQLIDIPPAGGDDKEPVAAAVAPGSSWTDVFSGLTMSVAQGEGSALNVTVSRNNACFTLGASTSTVAGSGGTGTVQVSAPASCSWSASSSDSWLTIQSGASSCGNGTVTFLAAANTGVARQGVLLIGGLGVLISQAPQIAGPVVVALSPSTISGPSAFLNLSLTDNTPYNFSTVTFNITSGPPAQPVCEMAWNEPNSQFLLTNDDGISYSVAPASGYLIDLENSTCAVLIASPSFYGPGEGTDFSFEVEVVWKNPTPGPKTIYLRAQDLFGNDTGWQSVGTWTTTVDQPPSQPVMPNVPGVGLNHLFTIEASDPDGAGDIQSVELDIGSGSQRCSMIYTDTIQDGVEFLNDDGTRSGWVTGISATASNSYCSLDLLRAQATSSGSTETVLLPVTFLSGLSGQQPVQAIVTDWSGKTATLNTTWNVAESSAQPAISAPGIVNGASFAPGGLAVGEIVTIFGSGLGPSPLQTASVVDKELQQAVSGTSVFFEGARAPLIYASESAVTAIVPPFLPEIVHVEVASAGGISNVVTLPLANEAPGIFTYPNSQQAVAVNQDYSFNIDAPASRGSYLTFYVTGDGNLFYNGAGFLDFGGVPPANPWATVPGPFLVQFGDGTPVPASFAGLTYPGVLQVNVLIDPSAPTGDAVPVQVVIPNSPAPNIASPAATIRIK
jgi:uncharacterized protein (TIGR03437 family)